jgi:hypothetical protein
MNKKELFIPFLAIGLGLAFAFVSCAVFLSNGKSKKWIARKIKVGGLLLTITAISCNGSQQVTCYDVAETNSMWINNTSQNGIEIRLDTGNVLNGTISTKQGNDFSFQVSDSAGTKFQKGMIKLEKDTVSYSEKFKLELDKNLKPGNYLLKLFAAKPESQDTIDPKRNFSLIIKNE